MFDFLLKAARLPSKSFYRLLLLLSLSWGLSVAGQALTPTQLGKITEKSVELAKQDADSIRFVLYSLDEFGSREQIAPLGGSIDLDSSILRKSFMKNEEVYFEDALNGVHKHAVPVFSQQNNLIGFVYCEFETKPDENQLNTVRQYANFYSILVTII